MQICNMDLNKLKIIDAIRATMINSGHKQIDVEIATGVDQTQVSKILNGKFKKVSGNLIKLCKYANIPPKAFIERKMGRVSEIDQAISSVWDGTDKHAKAIAEVIKSLVHFNVIE